MIRKSELKQVVHGPYVATPIPNAFDEKISYWLSKKECAVSIYMFTVHTGTVKSELEERLSKDGVVPYVIMLEEQLKQESNVERYIEMCQIINSGFDWINNNIYDEYLFRMECKTFFTGLSYMSLDFSHKGNWTWQQIGEFTQYHDRDKLKEFMKYLHENEVISYVELKDGVKDLKILK